MRPDLKHNWPSVKNINLCNSFSNKIICSFLTVLEISSLISDLFLVEFYFS